MDDFTKIPLGRKPMLYDHRDFCMGDYITDNMRKLAAQLTYMDWMIPYVLDQGETPHCVGFAWCGFGVSNPIVDNWQNDMGHTIYYAAKEIDGEPGQENGSTTRSGVQAFMRYACLENSVYVFATSIDDIIIWLLTKGPVVTGTNWYSSMFTPDREGIVTIGGYIAGGHEWMISGVDTVTHTFRCTNSWGSSYGIAGQFYISFDDYERLFNEQGDAVTAAEVIGTPVPPPQPEPSGCLPTALYKMYKWSLGKENAT